VRENGGQYTHAAIWTAMAFAKLGDNEKAWEILAMINPVNRGGSAQDIAAYKVEPYVVAADVYARPPHTGQGGWTWYTGSAGWMYQLITESLLGMRLDVNKLHVKPLVPMAWISFTLHYTYRRTVYHITMLRSLNQDARTRTTLDGVLQADSWLPLRDDGKEHFAEMEFHPSEVDLPVLVTET
jgi:cyclic beta-1,2-glucan synthetase